MKPCLWCGQMLRFKAGHGWTHPDGAVLVVRDGRDDHIATPDYGPARECTCETTGTCARCQFDRERELARHGMFDPE